MIGMQMGMDPMMGGMDPGMMGRMDSVMQIGMDLAKCVEVDLHESRRGSEFFGEGNEFFGEGNEFFGEVMSSSVRL